MNKLKEIYYVYMYIFLIFINFDQRILVYEKGLKEKADKPKNQKAQSDSYDAGDVGAWHT